MGTHWVLAMQFMSGANAEYTAGAGAASDAAGVSVTYALVDNATNEHDHLPITSTFQSRRGVHCSQDGRTRPVGEPTVSAWLQQCFLRREKRHPVRWLRDATRSDSDRIVRANLTARPNLLDQKCNFSPMTGARSPRAFKHDLSN